MRVCRQLSMRREMLCRRKSVTRQKPPPSSSPQAHTHSGPQKAVTDRKRRVSCSTMRTDLKSPGYSRASYAMALCQTIPQVVAFGARKDKAHPTTTPPSPSLSLSGARALFSINSGGTGAHTHTHTQTHTHTHTHRKRERERERGGGGCHCHSISSDKAVILQSKRT